MNSLPSLQELERAFATLAAAERSPEQRAPVRSARTLLLVSLSLVVFGVGTAAATNAIDVGAWLATSKDTPRDGVRYTSDRLVVAAGTDERAGRWQLSMTSSSAGDCLGLRLLDAHQGGISEGCGVRTETVGWRSNSQATIAMGRVRGDVAAVELRYDGRVVQTVRSVSDPRESRTTRYFFVVGPAGLEPKSVVLLNSNGKPLRDLR